MQKARSECKLTYLLAHWLCTRSTCREERAREGACLGSPLQHTYRQLISLQLSLSTCRQLARPMQRCGQGSVSACIVSMHCQLVVLSVHRQLTRPMKAVWARMNRMVGTHHSRPQLLAAKLCEQAGAHTQAHRGKHTLTYSM
eukprot:1148881-Pelagomonas_calceolata.AAC.8